LIIKNRLYELIFLVFAGVFIFFSSQKPMYNWDMIAYMGVAVEYQEHNLQRVHNEVYSSLQREVPASVYAGLTADIDDRHECAVSADAFAEELGFFRTKPLYTFLVFLFFTSGLPLVFSTLLPSIIASFVFLAIAYIWVAKYVKRYLAVIISAGIAFLPIVSEQARSSTPDALSSMLLLLTLYLLATNRKKQWVVLCMLLAVLARVDNVIFAIVVSFYLFLWQKKNMILKLGVILLAGAICLIGLPVLLGDSATWFTKFAFLFSFHDYVQHWRDVFYLLRTGPQYLTFIAIAIVLAFSKNEVISRIIRIISATVIIRLFLFPSLQERFFAAYEVAVVIMFVYYLAILSATLSRKEVVPDTSKGV
jgi:hypothetical protein